MADITKKITVLLTSNLKSYLDQQQQSQRVLPTSGKPGIIAKINVLMQKNIRQFQGLSFIILSLAINGMNSCFTNNNLFVKASVCYTLGCKRLYPRPNNQLVSKIF